MQGLMGAPWLLLFALVAGWIVLVANLIRTFNERKDDGDG